MKQNTKHNKTHKINSNHKNKSHRKLNKKNTQKQNNKQNALQNNTKLKIIHVICKYPKCTVIPTVTTCSMCNKGSVK